MITIKKISCLVILTAFLISPAFAETANGSYGFSLSPNIGILYGHSEEIVYHFPKNDLYLSELLWDLKPLLYAGLGADFGPLDTSTKQGFAAALSFKAGLPARTGRIENNDWFNPDPYYKTHYSLHNAYSGIAILLDVSASYFRRFFGSLVLNVYGEFSFMHFSWSAKDGYTQYASLSYPGGPYLPWDSTLRKTPVSGEVLRYKQDWLILSPGVSLEWDINRLFSVKTRFSYSPLIYCSDRDDHLLGNTSYFDYLYFGHYIKPGGEFILSPTQNTSISLSASYRYITGTRGDTVQGKKLDKDSAGAGYSALDFGLAVKFRLTGRD